MSLTTINLAKEQSITYQPLYLIEMIFWDGSTVLRLASENLDITTGGNQYKGFDWKPRILQQSIDALQATSDNGVITAPRIKLKLADADQYLWQTYELADGLGFKGAKLVLKLVFWDPDTNTFSSDEQVKFVGIVNAPEDSDDSSLTLLATNILNMANYNLPAVRIGRTCPWPFPVTHQNRVDAALNVDSEYFHCGYSPDVTDADGSGGTAAARGNLDPATGLPYTFCNFDWDSCIVRMGNVGLPDHGTGAVQIEQDQSGRHTGRFGGVRYSPPDDWRGNSYLSGTLQEGINNANEAKWNDYFPLVYGTCFVDPVVLNVVGGANTTLFEVALCVGQIASSQAEMATAVPLVIVNDYVVPHVSVSSDPSAIEWKAVTFGARDGSTNKGVIYDGSGDPYGSIVVIVITVPNKIAQSNDVPNVRCIVNGPKVRVWNSSVSNDFTYQFTQNAAWLLADMLTWGPFTAADFDLDTLIKAARVCDGLISYTDLLGTVQTHQRYEAGIALRERRSMAEIIKNFLVGMRGVLAPNAGLSDETAGLLQFFVKQTLAGQQPVPVEGSNNNAPFDSAAADGSLQVGYSAYSFNETNILRRGERGTASSFRITQRPISDTPNWIGFNFQDQDYSYTTDSLTLVDSEDVGRANQKVTGGIAAEGIINYDQGRRTIQGLFAEQFRGNPRTGFNDNNDSGGTWIAEFDASFRASHLRIGHIIDISYAAKGLDQQLFRVISISPDMNGERITIRAHWHEDDWYLDSYGQSPAPKLRIQRRHNLLRPPFGWSPNEVAPISGDPMFAVTEKSFGISQLYEAAADSTIIAKVGIHGKIPINHFSTVGPPYAPRAQTDPAGGAIPAGHYYIALTTLDSDGNTSPISWPLAQVTTTGATSQITLPNIYWQSGVIGYRLYAGTNPNKLSLQTFGSGTPSSVTFGSYNVSDEGAPDQEFHHFRFKAKHVWHSGVFGAAIGTVTATTIQIPGMAFTTDEWANRICSIVGERDSSDDLPIIDLRILSNTADTLTITGAPDLTTLNLKAGSALIMRTSPDIVSPITIGDSKFINSVHYYSAPYTILNATNTTPIILELSTPYAGATGDEALVQGITGNSAANGLFFVTVIDPTHIQLDTSSGNGDFESGGTIQEVTHGLRAHEETDRIVRIISGAGRYQRRNIVDNDTTTLTVDPPWDVTPDATSVFIIEDKAWLTETATTPIVNADESAEVQAYLTVSNFLEQVLWVQAFTEDSENNESVEFESPGREIYVFGGPGNLVVQYYPATFNVAVTADLTVANDVAPHYIVRRAGTALNLEAKIKIPSQGADVILDVILTKDDGSFSGSILNNPIVLPQNATDIVTTVDFISPLHLDEDDILTINCTQIGSTQPGRVVTIVLKIKVD
jgi:hypothetical protein